MLQGSLDNFAIDEVLTLLSTTQKTGRLAISGDRGTGSLWLETGGVVGGEASNLEDEATSPDVMFELLRFESGSFLFTMDDRLDSPGVKADVDALLGDAQDRITEWRTIEAVVPSLGHELWLTRSLEADDVLLSRRDWDAVVAVGEGNSVGRVCDLLELGEVDGSRMIKGLIERGVLQIGETPVAQTSPVSDDTVAGRGAHDSVGVTGFAAESFASEGFAAQGFATEDFASDDFAAGDFATDDFAPEGFTTEAVGADTGARFSSGPVDNDLTAGFVEADELAGFAAPEEEFEFLDQAAMADLEGEFVSEAPTTEPAPVASFAESLADHAPSFEAPVAEAPAFEAPSFEAPSFEAPSFEAPSFEAPVAEAPAFEAPSFDAPSFDAPSFDAPSFDAPTAEGPVARPFDTGPAFGAQPPARPPMPAPPTIGPDGAIVSGSTPPPPPAAADAIAFAEMSEDDDEASLLMRYLKTDSH